MSKSYVNEVYYSDLKYIREHLGQKDIEKLKDATLLITGCAGFLGFYIMSFFLQYADELKINKIIGIDNFKLGIPDWINDLAGSTKVELQDMDITQFQNFDTRNIQHVDYVMHMASIASPTFYRRYPLETVDANVWGLRMLLDFFKNKPLKGFLFFSSSEVYGDPPPTEIPTSETYRGNVAIIGPRACYDEAKRFGEVLCSIFAEQYQMPITIVRPFNNYGPGMKLQDKRVPADFANYVIRNENIILHSDGTPTRTFCYVADAIVGYIKALVYGSFDYFNIGIDDPEISVRELAEIYRAAGDELFGYTVGLEFKLSDEAKYLTHNPSRRCPDLTKARSLLHYAPSISIEEGVRRFLKFNKIGGSM